MTSPRRQFGQWHVTAGGAACLLLTEASVSETVHTEVSCPISSVALQQGQCRWVRGGKTFFRSSLGPEDKCLLIMTWQMWGSVKSTYSGRFPHTEHREEGMSLKKGLEQDGKGPGG